VDGIKKNVLVITGQGEQYEGPIHGVVRYNNSYIPAPSGHRTGAAILTNQYFASGKYEVIMKIEENAPSGASVALWTFHYEEHYPGMNSSKLNSQDPQYQPRFREGDQNSWYSTVNSEIDVAEIGYNGSYSQVGFNTWISDEDQGANIQKFDIENLADGKYHHYSMTWRTHLVATDLTDSQVKKNSAEKYYYASDDANSTIQGFPVVSLFLASKFFLSIILCYYLFHIIMYY
jgi:hypothetical protein